MNIFFIPSWYPTKSAPHAGIFFKEQIFTLAELYPGFKFFIDLWGHEDYTLHPRSPINSAVKIFNRLVAQGSTYRVKKNVWEFLEPRLSWTNKILGGNINQLMAATRQNFQKAQKIGKIDLIHAQVSFPAGYIAWKLSEEFKVPYIVSEHMGPFPFPSFLEKTKLSTQIRGPLRNANIVTAVSPSLKNQMEKFGFKNIEVIPNMVDEDFFIIKNPRKHLRKNIFSLSEISKNKGIDELIEVVSSLVKKRKDVELHLGGAGKVREVSKNLKFLGPISREKVKLEMQNCDVFFLPSHFETFSMVTAEALSCGKPVVATRCGGPESMIDKNNGILVKVGDVNAMVESLLKILNNKISYDSQKIRREFLQKFSKKITAEKIVKLYQKCVE